MTGQKHATFVGGDSIPQPETPAYVEKALSVLSPAKVNLCLDVGKRLASGRHEVDTILHTVELHDMIDVHFLDSEKRLDSHYASAGPKKNIRIRISIQDNIKAGNSYPARISPTKNLIFKITDILARKTGRRAPEGIIVHIQKNIPLQAGLGGGSSNAAAMLVVLCRAWGLSEEEEVAYESARETGSDVSFFLEGGCAEFGGYGDRFIRRLAPSLKPVVIIKPRYGMPTAEVYGMFDKMEPDADLRAHTRNDLPGISSADSVPLFNSLTQAAYAIKPELESVKEIFDVQDGDIPENMILCGSGSAHFAIIESADKADRLAQIAASKGLWSVATRFSKYGIQVVSQKI